MHNFYDFDESIFYVEEHVGKPLRTGGDSVIEWEGPDGTVAVDVTETVDLIQRFDDEIQDQISKNSRVGENGDASRVSVAFRQSLHGKHPNQFRRNMEDSFYRNLTIHDD